MNPDFDTVWYLISRRRFITLNGFTLRPTIKNRPFWAVHSGFVTDDKPYVVEWNYTDGSHCVSSGPYETIEEAGSQPWLNASEELYARTGRHA